MFGRRGLRWGSSAVALALIAAGVLEMGILPAGAITPERELLQLVNRERVRRDLRPLQLVRGASRLAEDHSRRMARRGAVSQIANLERKLDRRGYRFRVWGSNVACQDSLRRLHRSVMRRRASRKIVLDRRYRKIGLGVARTQARPAACDGATIWATQIFFG